ncbi:SHOCT domain-containing protein [Paenibacillus alkalitolerans]|uniref:hypothetical protein n=1 Tax=Paenibacillus alkalitolerans TaxID=2799335 RepID=UPI0018F5CDA4|nr:hypothetical protein [Paenibacillus alkalitolerans]
MGCCGSSSKHNNKQTHSEMDKSLSPLDLLKIRLAKGEITFDEYEKTKAMLQQ